MEDIRLISLLKIVEVGSYTKAAEKLSLTQPAVSQHIRQLEETLGIRIFERAHNRLSLTAEGKIVATVRRKIFSVHDHYFVTSALGDLQLRGNIFQFNYQILHNGVEIGHISRKLSLRDSFVLSLDDKYDLATFVALVIAIDNITDKRDADHSN